MKKHPELAIVGNYLEDPRIVDLGMNCLVQKGMAFNDSEITSNALSFEIISDFGFRHGFDSVNFLLDADSQTNCQEVFQAGVFLPI